MRLLGYWAYFAAHWQNAHRGPGAALLAQFNAPHLDFTERVTDADVAAVLEARKMTGKAGLKAASSAQPLNVDLIDDDADGATSHPPYASRHHRRTISVSSSSSTALAAARRMEGDDLETEDCGEEHESLELHVPH